MGKQAVSDLHAYAQEVSTFLSGANPNLPKDAVAELIKGHAAAVIRVIDEQGAKNMFDAYAAVRAASAHSHTIADPLAEAIVKQFPDKFGP